MWKRLQEYISRNPHDEGAKAISAEVLTLEALETMKATDGWKILHKKLREELQGHILQLIKDDVKIQTLLAILSTVETKQPFALLEEQVKAVIPEI